MKGLCDWYAFLFGFLFDPVEPLYLMALNYSHIGLPFISVVLRWSWCSITIIVLRKKGFFFQFPLILVWHSLENILQHAWFQVSISAYVLCDYWYNVGCVLGERSIVSCLCLPYQHIGLFTRLGVTTFMECILASLCYCVVLLLVKCCNHSILIDKTMHNKGQNCNKKSNTFSYVFPVYNKICIWTVR